MKKSKKQYNLLFSSTITFYLIALSVYAFWHYTQDKAEILENIDTKLYSCAIALKHILPDDFHDRAIDEHAISIEEDAYIVRKLMKLTEETDIKYIYTVIKKGDKLFFVADMILDAETERGTLYFYDYTDEADKSFFAAFDSTTPTYKTVSDQWGEVRTVMIPQTSPGGTKYLACADYDINYVKGLLRNNLLRSIATAVFFLLLGVPMMVIYIKHHSKYHKLLWESEEKYRRLTENAKDMIYRMSLPDGRYEYVNSASFDLLGYTPKEFYDHSALIGKVIHPEWMNYFEKEWKKLLAGKMSKTYEYKIVHKRGEERWLYQRNVLICDDDGQPIAIEGIVTDITERKRAQEELQREYDFSESIVNTAQIIILVLDKDGRIVRFNPYMEELTGYTLEEVKGKDWFTTFLPECDYDNIRQLFTKAIDDIKIKGNVNAILTKDKRELLIEWCVQTLKDANGNTVGLVSLGVDITERKNSEKALKRRDAILKAISFSAGKILLDSFEKKCVQEILKEIGESADVSRVYIFENEIGNDGELLMSQHYEWSALGVIPQIDNPQLYKLSYKNNGLERWLKVLSKGEIISGNVKDFPQEEREVLGSQDILSIVIVPIFVKDKWWGFIGFDECVKERTWSRGEKDALQTSASLIGAAIQRRNIEDALKSSNERFKVVMNSIDATVYVADMETYEILFMNTHLQNSHGNQVGKKCWASIQANKKGPCDFCTNTKLIDSNGKPSAPYVWEFQNTIDHEWYQCRDQAIQWIDGRIVRMEIATNISEQKKVEKELKQHRHHLESIVEERTKEIVQADEFKENIISTIPSAIVILNSRLEIRSANKRFFEIFGVEEKEIAGLNMCELVGCKSYQQEGACNLSINLANLYATDQQFISFENTIEFLAFDNPKILRFYLSRIIKEEEEEEVLLAIEDITKAKMLESQLVQSERLAATGRLAASIAHEINNPLQGITSHLDLMKDGLPEGSKKFKNYDQVSFNINRIRDIVSQLLDIYRSSNNARTTVDINDLITKIVNLINNQRRMKGVEIEQDLKKKLPKIIGWQQQLHQVFLNLLLNAIESLEPGGKISISTSCNKENIKIQIKDNGKGITKKNVGHVFDPFFSTKKDSGVGLGLFVCKGLIKNHHGEIEVESEEGEGSVFTITLPRR